jgi:molybdopterin synthase sulfur carrier subunit
MITVLIFGHALREAIGEPELQIECASPLSVQAFFDANTATLGALTPFIARHEVLVTVNKKVGSLESVIRSGDTLKLTHQTNQAFEGARWQNP